MSSKEKTFWIVFGTVMVLLIGGTGSYMAVTYSAYSDASSEHEKLARDKRKLETKAIYPSKANLADITGRVDQFQNEVNSLRSKLQQFQRPLESTIQAKEFPQILGDKVKAFRVFTRQEKPVIIPEDFYFGMNKYEKGVPPEAATGILKFELDAIERLLKMIIQFGSDEIYRVVREETPLEKGDKDPELSHQVAKYTVTVGFLTTHDGFRNFLNAVSNDKEFFYIIRVLRVDNEAKDGPERNVEVPKVFRNPETGEVVNVEAGKTIDQSLVAQDARVIFGKEKLRVTAVVDLCRFPEQPKESSEPVETKETKSPKNKPSSKTPSRAKNG